MERPRILIVDDDELVSLSLCKHIERMGHHVCGIVSSSEDTLNAITSAKPDLILMDIMLDGQLNGIEIAELVLERYNLPIIYLTANSDSETVERAKTTSPFGYLIKPIDENTLRVSIEMALYKHALENRIRHSQWLLEEINKAFLSFGSEPLENIAVICELISLVLDSACTMFLQLEADDIKCPACSVRKDGASCQEICKKGGGWMKNALACLGEGVTVLPLDELGPPWKQIVMFPLTQILHVPSLVLTVRQSETEISEEELHLAEILVNAVNAQEYRAKVIETKKQIAQQLARTQRLESIGTMADGVAHEINNPLMGIINLAQIIYDRNDNLDEVKSWSQEIINEGQRIARIVRSLLDFSRKESTIQARVDIGEIMEEVINLVKCQLEKDEIQLELELAPDLPCILCQQRQIVQVILNLVNNARDALLARLQTDGEPKLIRIFCLEDKEKQQVLIKVEDHGIGIPPEVHEHVFDPFYTTKPRHKASGLGLSVSYGIMHEHGGSLVFESDQEKGTIFTIALPAARTA